MYHNKIPSICNGRRSHGSLLIHDILDADFHFLFTVFNDVHNSLSLDSLTLINGWMYCSFSEPFGGRQIVQNLALLPAAASSFFLSSSVSSSSFPSFFLLFFRMDSCICRRSCSKCGVDPPPAAKGPDGDISTFSSKPRFRAVVGRGSFGLKRKNMKRRII